MNNTTKDKVSSENPSGFSAGARVHEEQSSGCPQQGERHSKRKYTRKKNRVSVKGGATGRCHRAGGDRG